MNDSILKQRWLVYNILRNHDSVISALHSFRRRLAPHSRIVIIMPRIKTNRTKKAPEGFDKISNTLDEFAIQLKEVQNQKGSKLSSKDTESTWQVFQIHHERSRYIYTLYYKRKAISKELYEWLLREKYADKLLIAKWKKTGYENLCCLNCIQSDKTVNGKTCICRVPRATLKDTAAKNNESVTFQQCVHCGCSGCASTD